MCETARCKMATVTIAQGQLFGTKAADIRGNEFFKFQGIPYAKAPLGNLRFKAPQPPEKWSGVYDATTERDICYSRDPLKKGEVAGSENCLFLNVYTKNVDDEKNLSPVLVWIHGGGLIWGSGNEEFYGPDFLLTEDVVLVTINYRLGLLGFVSFEDPELEIPGNAGLKDQAMALKWVQDNISKFGGDPGNVTIFGESAGAASVHLLMLSPMTKGLFHKAIAQSGSALNPWVAGTTSTKALADAMELEGADEKILYESLIEKSVEEVFQIQEKMFEDLHISQRRPVGPVVEKNSKEPFLDEEPLTKVLSGDFHQVPFMTGYTTAEGMFSEIFKDPTKPNTVNFEHFVPWFFGYQPGSSEAQAVATKIGQFYFGDVKDNQELVTRGYDLFGDCQIAYGVQTTVLNQFQKSKAPTYFYKISVESELNYFKKLWKIELPGVSHLDDIGYLFKNHSTPEIKPGSLEDISMSRFVKLWTNFAKFGDPTPGNDPLLKIVWKPVTGANLDFLDIGGELTPMTNPDPDRINFWASLFAESPRGLEIK